MTHSAFLNGTVNANGSDTTARFEWGLDTTYGNVVELGVVTGNTVTPFSSQITNLVALTTYHFRISATNEAGISNGVDMEFTTLADTAAPIVETLPATNIT